MITVHSTRNCGQTPRVLFALEELGVPWEIAFHEDGYFAAHYGMPGPLVEDGAAQILQLGAILRYLARAHGDGALFPPSAGQAAEIDQWMDYYLTGIRTPIVDLLRERGLPPESRDNALVDRASAELRAALAVVERGLADRDHLTGRFSIADCEYLSLMLAPRLGIDLAPFPGVLAYVERLTARPAWVRSQKRLREARGG
jgi:glutathione S-transferase